MTNGNGKHTRNSREYIATLEVRLKKPAERTGAIAALCEAFEPLVLTMARRYIQPIVGAEVEELEQQARLGLLEACETFDRRKGAFSAHAMWGIRSYLSRYVQRLECPTRFPTKLMHQLPTLHAAEAWLGQKLMREATLEELSGATGIPEGTVAALLVFTEGPVQLDLTIREVTDDAHGSGGGVTPDDRLLVSPTLTPEELLIAREELAAYKGEL
jgi:DNA-directed RNA polymerase sigma subunit (sigma70/sigma32)